MESRRDLAGQDYDPQPGEKLFHYCTFDALWGILDSREIWLTSFSSLNDRTEWQWGQDLTRSALSACPSFSSAFRAAVEATLDEAGRRLNAVLFCLSLNGDLLGQWWAYAADGAGAAIEFDASLARASLPVNMKRVLYTIAEQEETVKETLAVFWSWWRRGDAGIRAVLDVLRGYAADLLTLKHPSFVEEQEVRMVHLLVRDGDSHIDPGGHTRTEAAVAGLEVRYRREEPYIALPFDPSRLISGVVAGPKSELSADRVSKELRRRGLSKVSVSESACPYR